MLTINNISLSKCFNVSLTLFPSSIMIIRGKNGVGKSSFLRMIANIQKPQTGQILLDNIELDHLQKPYAVYIGHRLGIKDEFTTIENLRFASQLYNSEAMVIPAMQYFGLRDVADKKAYTLSAGNRQKLAIARLLCCNANLWLLDEIETHLDENNMSLVHNAIIAKANNGGIVIMSSHHKSNFRNAVQIDLDETYK
jgi:heme exporter protein A